MTLTGIGLKVIPISTATTCGLSVGNRVIHEVIMQKYIKFKKQYEKNQQKIKSFDQLYRKSLQDNIIDKSEYESPCNSFTRYLENESFS